MVVPACVLVLCVAVVAGATSEPPGLEQHVVRRAAGKASEMTPAGFWVSRDIRLSSTTGVLRLAGQIAVSSDAAVCGVSAVRGSHYCLPAEASREGARAEFPRLPLLLLDLLGPTVPVVCPLVLP